MGSLALLCALPASAGAADYVQVPLAVKPIMIKGNIDPGSCSTAVRLQWPIVANEDPRGYFILHYWQGGTEQKNEIGSAFFQDAPFGNEEYTWPGAEAGNHARYFGYGTAPAEGGPPRWDDCEESIENWEAGLAGSPTYVEVPVLAVPPAPPPGPPTKTESKQCSAAQARVRRQRAQIKASRKGRRRALARRAKVKNRLERIRRAEDSLAGHQLELAQMKERQARSQLRQINHQIQARQKTIQDAQQKIKRDLSSKVQQACGG